MLCLIYLVAILAIVVQGQTNDSCKHKYYVVNNFQVVDTVYVACYAQNGSSCEIYHSAAGIGCDEGAIEYVGTAYPNETLTLTSIVRYSDGFCSNNQFSVYFVDGDDTVIAQLSNPTDAGTRFKLGLPDFGIEAEYQCTISALFFTATVALNYHPDDVPEEIVVDPFRSHILNFHVDNNSPGLMSLVSDKPVIVSCIGKVSPVRMVTLEPISSKALLSSSNEESTVSVVLSSCLTNELITNFGLVDLKWSQEAGNACNQKTIPNDYMLMYSVPGPCTLLATPIGNDTCVSVSRLYSHYLRSVGIPELKFSTEIQSHPDIAQAVVFYSFSLASCKVSSISDWPSSFNFSWLPDELNERVAFYVGSHPLLSLVKNISCDSSVFPYLMNGNDKNELVPFVMGNRSHDLWVPFLESQGCSTHDYTITPATVNSNARSQISVKSWVGLTFALVFYDLLL